MAEPASSNRINRALASLTEMSDPLERLEAIRSVRETLDLLAQGAADEARATGATWKRIGGVYGVSKQAAQQRFRRPATPLPHDAGDSTTPHTAGPREAPISR